MKVFNSIIIVVYEPSGKLRWSSYYTTNENNITRQFNMILKVNSITEKLISVTDKKVNVDEISNIENVE